jgi:hypothetical protein
LTLGATISASAYELGLASSENSSSKASEYHQQSLQAIMMVLIQIGLV